MPYCSRRLLPAFAAWRACAVRDEAGGSRNWRYAGLILRNYDDMKRAAVVWLLLVWLRALF